MTAAGLIFDSAMPWEDIAPARSPERDQATLDDLEALGISFHRRCGVPVCEREPAPGHRFCGACQDALLARVFSGTNAPLPGGNS